MNVLQLEGKLINEPTLFNSKYNTDIYIFDLSISRYSGVIDIVRIISPLKNIPNVHINDYIKISGEIRTYVTVVHNKKFLEVYGYAHTIEKIKDIKDCSKNNSILLDGILKTKIIPRTTPSGRKISDFILKVKRSYNKVSYIPCICWGLNSIISKHLAQGSKIHIQGRMQYRKGNKRDYYEVSVQDIEMKEVV